MPVAPLELETELPVLTDDDVHRAKAQLKANIISQLDALAHVCEEIGRQFLTYDRRVPLAELLARENVPARCPC